MLKTYENLIQKPWTIKIEQSYGCNLSCKFCPIDNLPEINANKEFLSQEMCKRIVKQSLKIRKDFRVELTLRGEPTLNPNILQNISIIREVAPEYQISLFTNGLLVMKNQITINDLLDAGVNILCIDCYNNTYDRFKKIAKQSKEKVVDFKDFTAYKRHSKGHELRVVNLVPDIQEGSIDVRKIHNNAGNVSTRFLMSLPEYPQPKLPMEKSCARPFRELVVYHNGDVVICCHDWQAENVLGNVEERSLYEIWYGASHLKVLRKLYNKDRSTSPCNKCDYHGGYRLGFLQNPAAPLKPQEP